jgi:serine/threonine protein kinase
MDYTSGFLSSPDIPDFGKGTELQFLGASERGYCELWKGAKEGKFRVYKCLKAEYVGNPLYESLLRKEFNLGYSLSHPNIYEFYSFTTLPGKGNAIEMEWVDGCSLETLIDKNQLSKELKVKIIDEICDALAYIHSKQIIHRDLKPSNILITHNGHNVKIIDFGLSDSDSWSILKTPAGTKLYAAPELLAGESIDNRADIYSLGVIISQMGPRRSKLSTIAAKCCRRSPSDRYASATEVKADLHRPSNWTRFAFTAAALASLWIIYSLIPHPNKGENVTQTDSLKFKHHVDTMVIIQTQAKPTPVQSPETPAQTKAQEKEEPDTAALNKIVRQATDMFE